MSHLTPMCLRGCTILAPQVPITNYIHSIVSSLWIYWCAQASTRPSQVWKEYQNHQSLTRLNFLARSTPNLGQFSSPVCMFDKFQSTFNFKSKVSCDVFTHKNKMKVNWNLHFISKLSPQCHMPSGTCHFNIQ